MNDFIAGLVGGLSGLVVGYPFDTIKALMQTKEAHNSIVNSARILITQTKSAGFFRGLTLPLITYGPVTSMGFGVYGAIGNVEQKPAGSFSGFILTPIKNPFEVIRIQLQTNCKSEIKGPQKCIEEIYKKKGVRGFYSGLGALTLRDSVSFGIYFCVFDFFRSKGLQFGGNSFFVDLLSGGVAGSISWFTILPLDIIKTRLQANRNERTSFLHEFAIIYRNVGIRGFYKGLSAVILRAFLVNSLTLCFYKQSLDFLNIYNFKFAYLNHEL